jgi:deazaflavin-dependent oxidoreductase (nitroreductase family)
MTARHQIRLFSRGRHSGKPRQATLYAWPDGDALVIVGSAGGRARHPAWVHNLRAAPDAEILEGKKRRPVHAREATGRERQRLWQLVTKAFPMYAAFQRRTSRTLPLFVLEDATPDPKA